MGWLQGYGPWSQFLIVTFQKIYHISHKLEYLQQTLDQATSRKLFFPWIMSHANFCRGHLHSKMAQHRRVCKKKSRKRYRSKHIRKFLNEYTFKSVWETDFWKEKIKKSPYKGLLNHTERMDLVYFLIGHLGGFMLIFCNGLRFFTFDIENRVYTFGFMCTDRLRMCISISFWSDMLYH